MIGLTLMMYYLWMLKWVDGLPKVTKIKTPRSYKPKLDPVYKFCVLIDLEGTYDRLGVKTW
jgi:hypothetical protein